MSWPPRFLSLPLRVGRCQPPQPSSQLGPEEGWRLSAWPLCLVWAQAERGCRVQGSLLRQLGGVRLCCPQKGWGPWML